jgi:hypothetical protein
MRHGLGRACSTLLHVHDGLCDKECNEIICLMLVKAETKNTIFCEDDHKFPPPSLVL